MSQGTSSMGLKDLIGLNPDALRCPYPIYENLRDAGAPVYVPEMSCWIVSRYEDVLQVVRHPETFSSVAMTGGQLSSHRERLVSEIIAREPELGEKIAVLRTPQRVLIWADPPEHRRHRKLVNRAFTPAKVASLEPSIREVSDKLVDAFIADGHADLVSQFGVLLPLTIIAKRFGIADDEFPQFKAWSDAVVSPIGNPGLTDEQLREVMIARYEMGAFFLDKVRQRREQPADDLISDVADARTDERPLTDREIVDMLGQIIVAGNETTTKLIALAMKMLMEDPALMQRLGADRSLIGSFIEEALRIEPPTQALYRTATADAEVGDARIKAGDQLMLCYASANRDESKFPNAGCVDLERPNLNAHMTFGNGEHFCLGSALARLEAKVAVEVLLGRLRDIAPAPGVDLGHLDFEPSFALHGPRRLDVTFRPAKSAQ